MNSIIEPNLTDLSEGALKRWQRVTRLVQLIWNKWHRGYLSELQQRNKWQFQKKNVKVGDLVVLIEDNMPTFKWPLGRVTKIYSGNDTLIRVVKVKAQNGWQSFHKLCDVAYPLPNLQSQPATSIFNLKFMYSAGVLHLTYFLQKLKPSSSRTLLLLSEIQFTRVLNLNEKLDDNLFEVYTDGSKNAGGVVFSVCILKEEIQHEILSFKLDSHNTDFHAELAALGEAAAWAVKTNNKINIFKDIRSSIDALKSHKTKFKFVNSIKEKFCLAEGLAALTWVKAHVGNELTDHFAKLACIDIPRRILFQNLN
ncbi:hypothetical protein AVEN_94223-1 [Araneus ventricosus]|uniref:Uncharacterized protein n=1 Tax=Araneus ventricosus TaxID=182803 RepID=A0A4Y2QAI1_ARAVE|nr:hypothetical protein AVEN_94223-1 [Araneus ventricosus]